MNVLGGDRHDDQQSTTDQATAPEQPDGDDRCVEQAAARRQATIRRVCVSGLLVVGAALTMYAGLSVTAALTRASQSCLPGPWTDTTLLVAAGAGFGLSAAALVWVCVLFLRGDNSPSGTFLLVVCLVCVALTVWVDAMILQTAAEVPRGPICWAPAPVSVPAGDGVLGLGGDGRMRLQREPA